MKRPSGHWWKCADVIPAIGSRIRHSPFGDSIGPVCFAQVQVYIIDLRSERLAGLKYGRARQLPAAQEHMLFPRRRPRKGTRHAMTQIPIRAPAVSMQVAYVLHTGIAAVARSVQLGCIVDRFSVRVAYPV